MPSLDPPLYYVTNINDFRFFLMFVLEHVSPLHFLGKQNSSKCHSFCRVNIGEIRFSVRISVIIHLGTATFDYWVR